MPDEDTPDTTKWEEKEAVTDRPNDIPLRGVDTPALPNSTLSDRAKARSKSEKRIEGDSAENKAVTTAAKKTTRKRS